MAVLNHWAALAPPRSGSRPAHPSCLPPAARPPRSFQTLPRPTNIAAATIAAKGDADWLAEARTIHALGQMANDRFQTRYDGIPDVVPAGVHYGGLTT